MGFIKFLDGFGGFGPTILANLSNLLECINWYTGSYGGVLSLSYRRRKLIRRPEFKPGRPRLRSTWR